jgi:hypothetical protein
MRNTFWGLKTVTLLFLPRVSMILGKGCSRSLSVSQYKLVKGNFVFFLDEGACDWFWKAAPSRVGYDMKDEDLVFAPPLTGSSKNLNTTTAWIFTC